MTPHQKIAAGGTVIGMLAFMLIGGRVGGFRGAILGAVVAGIGGWFAYQDVSS